VLAVILAGIQIALLILKEYLSSKAERKKKIEGILKEVSSAKTASDITRIFSRINRVR
jgi:hypothetical protein